MKPVRSPLRTEINITPLIDIVLVLLIVFIVMVPALAHAQRTLASGRSTHQGPVVDLPRISVLGEGRYLYGTEEIGGEALVRKMATALATQPVKDRKVVLRVPPDMPLRTASEALDLVHLAAARVGEAEDVRAILLEAHSLPDQGL